MWNRGGIRSTALERANAQLSGKRLISTGAAKANGRRDVANFGNGLLQARHTSFQDLSDLFSEDPESENQDYLTDSVKMVPHFAEPLERFDVGGGSRFLKKSAANASADRQSSAPGRTTADANDLKIIPWHRSQSEALSRLALIEDRFRNHNKKLGLDTDKDFPLAHEPGLSDLSSSDPSMAGSRFLKKKVTTTKDQKDPVNIQVDTCLTPVSIASRVDKRVSLDSDEEDMRRLLGESLDSLDGNWNKVMRQTETRPQMDVKTYRKTTEKVVSAMPSAEKHEEKLPVSSAFTDGRNESRTLSPPSSPKIPSPRRPVSLGDRVTRLSLSSSSGHSEIKSLDELFPVACNDEDTLSEKSVTSDDFKLNVMTLDDLAPVSFGMAELSKEKGEASLHVSRHSSLSSAKEVSCVPWEHPAEYESDFESEIHNETAISANEISEHLSDREEHSSLATELQSHSHESRDDDDEHMPSEELSSISRSKSDTCLSRCDGSHSSSHTSDSIITSSEPHSPTARRTVKDATVQTHTDGLTYTWSSGHAVLGTSVGMCYTDPIPVASHTISAEAVEALSTYSPAVFALNDMLRQQLALTRSFIESSRHLHQAVVQSLGRADYRYTTLEETKEFIRCNRSPRLTMEDALTEVLQEMRDYHYI